jgi:hypothetical protein
MLLGKARERRWKNRNLRVNRVSETPDEDKGGCHDDLGKVVDSLIK